MEVQYLYKRMKKVLFTLAGSAMLISVLTLSASEIPLKDTGKTRSQRRSLFAELSKKEKDEMRDMVAQDLSDILGQSKDEIKEKINGGENIKDIISGYGATVEDVLSVAKERQRQALLAEIELRREKGQISEDTRKVFLEKMTHGK